MGRWDKGTMTLFTARAFPSERCAATALRPDLYYICKTMPFDYDAPVEMFISQSMRPGRRPLEFRRFESAAAALRFAIEELPPALLVGTVMEVGDERFGAADIRRLYESSNYPLARREA